MESYMILIADDDPNQLKILTGHLIEHNPQLNLLIATNGETAAKIAIDSVPDLILMDWEMPALNGVEAIRLIKGNNKTRHIPIIMVTGTHGDIGKLKEALDSGAIDFIRKPFSGVELIARIETQLRHIEIQKKVLHQVDVINNQEKELIEKENMLLQSEILHHQKQLTMNTVNLLKQGQLLQAAIDDLNSALQHSNEEGRRLIKLVISSLNNKSNDLLWNEFEVIFEKVHSDFYPKLVKKMPDISIRERRLCAFLKMNMSTKEIASITFQSQNAIDVAKHRLRKKLGTESDEDFTNFLISL